MSEANKLLPNHYRFREVYDEPGVSIQCIVFSALAETPAGYWVMRSDLASLAPHMNKEWIRKHRRFVPKQSRRRHCYPTKTEALESFLSRKKHHIGHMEFSLSVARAAYEKAQAVKDQPEVIEAIGYTHDEKLFCSRPDCFDDLVWDY